MTSRWSTDRKIKMVFTLAFALLSTIPLVVYSNKQQLLEANRWVSHTYEVIATLESSVRAVADAESAKRGYVISGDESYLGAYEASSFGAKKMLAKLRDLTADNRSQQFRLDALKPLMSPSEFVGLQASRQGALSLSSEPNDLNALLRMETLSGHAPSAITRSNH